MSAPTAAPAASFQETILAAGSRIYRVHWTTLGAIWFGPRDGDPPSNRFDAPGAQFKTLYAGEDLAGPFAETVLRKAARIIARSEVTERSWSELQLARDVRLAKLHGSGLNAANVTGDIVAGDDYTLSQAKALEIYHAGFDGIIYRSRHNDDHLCYALFSRVAEADLVPVDVKSFADHLHVAQGFLDEVGGAWEKSEPLPDFSTLP